MKIETDDEVINRAEAVLSEFWLDAKVYRLIALARKGASPAADIEALKAALKPFAELSKRYKDAPETSSLKLWVVTYDLRRAAEAYAALASHTVTGVIGAPRPIEPNDKAILVKLDDGEFLVLNKWRNGNWHSSAGNIYIIGEDFENLVYPLSALSATSHTVTGNLELEAIVRHYACECPGDCERIEGQRDMSCRAHNAIRALSAPGENNESR